MTSFGFKWLVVAVAFEAHQCAHLPGPAIPFNNNPEVPYPSVPIAISYDNDNPYPPVPITTSYDTENPYQGLPIATGDNADTPNQQLPIATNYDPDRPYPSVPKVGNFRTSAQARPPAADAALSEELTTSNTKEPSRKPAVLLEALLSQIYGDDSWKAQLSAPMSGPIPTPPPRSPGSQPRPPVGQHIRQGFYTNEQSGADIDSSSNTYRSEQADTSQYDHRQQPLPDRATETSGLPTDPYHGAGSMGDRGHSENYGTGADSGLNFNANKVNQDQHIFNPASMVARMPTQSGSTAQHGRPNALFDANELNRNFMQSVEPDQPKANGYPQQTGNHYNTYLTQSQAIYDANAVNSALTENQRPNAYSGLTQQTNDVPTGAGNVHHVKEIMGSNKADQSDKPAANVPYYGFIPGSMYPGMSENSPRQAGVHAPSYLQRTSGIHNAMPVFDADAVNARQAVYHPDSVPWVLQGNTARTRRDDAHGQTSVPSSRDTATASSSQAVSQSPHEPSVTTAAPAVSIPQLTHVTVSNSKPETKKPIEIPESSNTDYASSLGFNPDQVNAFQGQSSFVPGQLSSGGANSGTDEQAPFIPGQLSGGQSSGFVPGQLSSQPSSFNHNSVATSEELNFNFAKLLGINVDTNSTTGGMGIGSTTYGTSGGTSNSTHGQAGGYSMGTANGLPPMPGIGTNDSHGNYGFDSNAANAGFVAVGNGYTGFGNGMGDGGFNPDMVNQMSIENPFMQQTRGNKTVDMDSIMNYFLGVGNSGSSGGGMYGGGTANSHYTSPFISEFDPSTVNQATYDPNKYNTAHMNFDPIDMLSRNPGIDKDILQSATFNPDKINAAGGHLSFSPAEMLSQGLGVDKNKLSSGAIFDHAVAGQAVHNGPNTAASVFDPISVMEQMMQSSGNFHPGYSGSEQIHFDPLAMFNHGGRATTPSSGTAAMHDSETPSQAPSVTHQPATTPVPGTTAVTPSPTTVNTAPSTSAVSSTTSPVTSVGTAVQ